MADLNNDGLLDVVLAADPDNSSRNARPERYEDRVYWNTGADGGRANHWLRLRFAGVTDAELIGARIEARRPGGDELLGTRVVAADHSYKSGSPLEAHFGLGGIDRADLTVTLLSGQVVRYGGVDADRFLGLDLADGDVRQVAARPERE